MKLITAAVLLLGSLSAHACESTFPVKGMITLETCEEPGPSCIAAQSAIHSYLTAHKDTRPDVLRIALHGSPWHLYDADHRIYGVDELADLVRSQGSAIERVELSSSWSSFAPDKHGKSLAQKLSAALGGMPVSGEPGFVWYTADGKTHTTRQAFTAGMSGRYLVPKNGKVMASYVPGAILAYEEAIMKAKDSNAMVELGMAADVYLLCPDKALRSFEASAALGNAVGAYNAAMLRLARGKKGDQGAAITLLKQAAAAGDKKAALSLQKVAR